MEVGNGWVARVALSVLAAHAMAASARADDRYDGDFADHGGEVSGDGVLTAWPPPGGEGSPKPPPRSPRPSSPVASGVGSLASERPYIIDVTPAEWPAGQPRLRLPLPRTLNESIDLHVEVESRVFRFQGVPYVLIKLTDDSQLPKPVLLYAPGAEGFVEVRPTSADIAPSSLREEELMAGIIHFADQGPRMVRAFHFRKWKEIVSDRLGLEFNGERFDVADPHPPAVEKLSDVDLSFLEALKKSAQRKCVQVQQIPAGSSFAVESQLLKEVTEGTQRFGVYNLIVRAGGQSSRFTALMRNSDGMHIVLDHGYDSPALSDGILSFSGLSPRSFDLRRFAYEARAAARMQPTKTPVVADGEKLPTYVDMRVRVANAEAIEGGIPAEVQADIERAFAQGKNNSVALLGEAGTGKDLALETFVRNVVSGNSAIPRTWRILYVTPEDMGAGSKYVGNAESRVQHLKYLANEMPTIFAINEFHAMRGQGTSSTRNNDVFQYIKPELAAGQLMIFALDTPDEYYAQYGGDAAIVQRFNVVKLGEPSGDVKLRDILRNNLKSQRIPLPSDEVLDLIRDLSSEFNPVGAQPRKQILLAERVLGEKVRSDTLGEVMTAEQVRDAAASLYGVDKGYFQLRERLLRVDRARKLQDERVVGQTDAKDTMNEMRRQRITGVADPVRPDVILLAGPPGLGKTLLANAEAEGMGLPVPVRINMALYAHGRSPEEFLQELKRAIDRNAHGGVFLDETEKAHLSIQNALLDVFDSGMFTVQEQLGSGAGAGTASVRVSARNVMFVMAANAGTAYIERLATPSNFGLQGVAREQSGREHDWREFYTEAEFRDELVNGGISKPLLDRVKVSPVVPPSRAEFAQVLRTVVNYETQIIAKRVGRTIQLQNFDEFVTAAVAKLYRPGLSNRECLRLMDDVVRKDVNAQLSRDLVAELSRGQAAERTVKVDTLQNFRDRRGGGGKCSQLF